MLLNYIYIGRTFNTFCHSGYPPPTLHVFCTSFAPPLVTGRWQPFRVWTCSNFLSIREFFLATVAPHLLWGPCLFFPVLYKVLREAFDCDLLLYKLRLTDRYSKKLHLVKREWNIKNVYKNPICKTNNDGSQQKDPKQTKNETPH